MNIPKALQKFSHVVIVGMKGVGKTTIGHELSKRLEYSFIDSDKEIETLHQSSCREIWMEQGERQFRKIEEGVILNLRPFQKSVIVLGGGAIESVKVREFIGSLGVVFCLYMKKEELQRRWEREIPFYHQFEEIYQRRTKQMSYFSGVWVDAASHHVVEVLERIVCGK